MEEFMERYQEIERSIIKKYRKEIWCKFTTAINDYQLLQQGDRIAVCISEERIPCFVLNYYKKLSVMENLIFD